MGYKFGFFYRKYSDVTHFVIIIIFRTDDNLITHKFSVTVTGYIILFHVTSYSTTLHVCLCVFIDVLSKYKIDIKKYLNIITQHLNMHASVSPDIDEYGTESLY